MTPVDLLTLRVYFLRLGLTDKIADLYASLYAHGPQAISELSRNAGVERTHIYRLMNELSNSGLIEIEVHNKKSILRAAPITNLKIMLSKKEQEIKDLRDDLQQLSSQFNSSTLRSPTTRVQAYQGSRD